MTARHVLVDATELAAIGVALDIIETWLHHAPGHIITDLARSAYGEQSERALTWARLLLSDLRYHRATLSCALRAAQPATRKEPPS